MDGSTEFAGAPVIGETGGSPVRTAPVLPAASDAEDRGPAPREFPVMAGDSPRLAATAPSFESRAKAAAEKFESFFIAQMLRQMRSGANQFADEDSAARNPLNADMLSLADGLLADQLAGRHAFGVADAILRQLLPKADDRGLIERPPA
jgi:flagellar protein FlgJ